MRIVLDTNVIISAFFWKGNERKLLERCRAKEFELVVSPDILDEVDRVLNLKFSISDDKRADFSRNMLLCSRLVFPSKQIDAIKDDPSDNRILECAIDGNAEYIVSGDKHLLSLGKYKNIKILNTKTFLGNVK